MSDIEPLLVPAPASRWTPLRSSLCCLLTLLAGLLGLALALLLSYLLTQGGQTGPLVNLKVMALNTWGMPASLGAEDKELRMEAIGRLIQEQEYDVYLLEELWMKPDHATIQRMLPEGFHMTEVHELNNPHQWTSCDGVVGPDGCSGLAIVSRHNLTQVEFFPYSDHGDAFWGDGEYLARKGVGRVRVEPHPNITVDLFVTHTCASDYNYYYRQRQVKELVTFVSQSDADFVILGGDFNVDPRANGNETTYHDIRNIMTNSIEEFFIKLEEWLTPARASYANPANTYSNIFSPVLYDYIFHKAKGANVIITNVFKIPFLKTVKALLDGATNTTTQKEVSLSDHEAVTADLLLWK